eukprot:scaffold1033_cov171-Amphora_coffeaeformis.AAC.4
MRDEGVEDVELFLKEVSWLWAKDGSRFSVCPSMHTGWTNIHNAHGVPAHSLPTPYAFSLLFQKNLRS